MLSAIYYMHGHMHELEFMIFHFVFPKGILNNMLFIDLFKYLLHNYQMAIFCEMNFQEDKKQNFYAKRKNGRSIICDRVTEL